MDRIWVDIKLQVRPVAAVGGSVQDIIQGIQNNIATLIAKASCKTMHYSYSLYFQFVVKNASFSQHQNVVCFSSTAHLALFIPKNVAIADLNLFCL